MGANLIAANANAPWGPSLPTRWTKTLKIQDLLPPNNRD
jgi:hypothetical protein